MPHRRCICTGCPACGDGCGRLYDREATGTWRCPSCQAQAGGTARARRARAAARRPSSTARGYGSVYRRNRDLVVAQAVAAARAGQPQRCWLCKRPCLASQKLTAEHKTPIRNGGTHDLANLAPAHSACNTAWNRSHPP